MPLIIAGSQIEKNINIIIFLTKCHVILRVPVDDQNRIISRGLSLISHFKIVPFYCNSAFNLNILAASRYNDI